MHTVMMVMTSVAEYGRTIPEAENVIHIREYHMRSIIGPLMESTLVEEYRLLSIIIPQIV